MVDCILYIRLMLAHTNTDLSLFSVHGDQRQHEWRRAPGLAQGGSCGCCCCCITILLLLLLLLQIRSVLQVPCYSTAGLGWLSLVAAAVMVVTAGVAAAGYRQLRRCRDTCPDTGTRAAETTGPVELGKMDVSVISEHYWGGQSRVRLLHMNTEPEMRSSQQYPGGACLWCLPLSINFLQIYICWTRGSSYRSSHAQCLNPKAKTAKSKDTKSLIRCKRAIIMNQEYHALLKLHHGLFTGY